MELLAQRQAPLVGVGEQLILHLRARLLGPRCGRTCAADSKLPDHCTLYAFRKKIERERFEVILTWVVWRCKKAGLISNELLHFDAYDQKLATINMIRELVQSEPWRFVLVYEDEFTYYRRPTVAHGYALAGSDEPYLCTKDQSN